MKIRDQLGEFAGRFVICAFRERFIHEALKKPAKLHERICHRIEQVFPSRYSGGQVPFQSGDKVIPLVGTNQDLNECLWQDIAEYSDVGGGMLVISTDLMHFYAETEAEPRSPSILYSS